MKEELGISKRKTNISELLRFIHGTACYTSAKLIIMVLSAIYRAEAEIYGDANGIYFRNDDNCLNNSISRSLRWSGSCITTVTYMFPNSFFVP